MRTPVALQGAEEKLLEIREGVSRRSTGMAALARAAGRREALL